MRNKLCRSQRPYCRSQVANLLTRTDVFGGATFSIDALNPSLDPRVVFQRTGTATVLGPNLLIQTVSANVPRWEYGPDGFCRGLLIESTATNQFTYSQSLSTSAPWTRTNLITTSWTGMESPDGSSTGVKLMPSTTSGVHQLTYGGTLPTLTGAFVGVTIFAKASGRNFFGISFGTSNPWASFDLSNPESTLVGNIQPGPGGDSVYIADMVNYPNGWKRVRFYTKTHVTIAPSFSFVAQQAVQNPSTAYAGVGTNGILAWGAQLEYGGGGAITSYIPTTTAAVTRGYDNVSVSPSKIGFDKNSGTILYRVESDISYGTPYEFSNINDERLMADLDADQVFYASDLSNQTWISGTSCRWAASAFCFSAGHYSVILNVGEATVDQIYPLAFSIPMSNLQIGCHADNPDGSNINGVVRTFRYWPKQLPDAALYYLTR